MERMAIKIETIESLRAKIKDAPEVAKESRTVNKQEAIRELKNDIETMRKRGYTFEGIAKFLTDGGLKIGAATLKSYLQRTKTDKTKATKQEKSKPAVAASTATNEAANKTKQAVAEKLSQPDKKGGFVVRPDSEI